MKEEIKLHLQYFFKGRRVEKKKKGQKQGRKEGWEGRQGGLESVRIIVTIY